MSFRARTIVLEDAAEKAADAASSKYQRFDHVFFGLQWLLARKPEQGIELRVEGLGTRIYVAGSDPLAQTPVVWVRYSYDDNEVIIYDINVRDA